MRQLLQPIIAFVYCSRQAPPAGASRPPAVGERWWTTLSPGACATDCALELRPFSKIILFHFRRGSVL